VIAAGSIIEALQLECEAQATLRAYESAATCAGCGYALAEDHCPRCERERAPAHSFVGLRVREIEDALEVLHAAA
jgi:predicted amidophosphoribosyltransferase